MLYEGVKDSIIHTIELYESEPLENDLRRIRTHYFLEGMRVCLQLIDQVEEIDKNELVYETFENVVKSLRNALSKEDMLEIIDYIHDEI